MIWLQQPVWHWHQQLYNSVTRLMAEETFNICTTGPALAALLHSMALQGQRDYDGLILG